MPKQALEGYAGVSQTKRRGKYFREKRQHEQASGDDICSICRDLQSNCVARIKTCKAGRNENKGKTYTESRWWRLEYMLRVWILSNGNESKSSKVRLVVYGLEHGWRQRETGRGGCRASWSERGCSSKSG